MISKESKTRFRSLTSKERGVLNLFGEGYKNEEIAARLGLTVSAVNRYKANLMEKRPHSIFFTAIQYAQEKTD